MSDRYTPEQVERALKAIVLSDSHIPTASRRLAQEGLPIPERTLRDWRNEHAAQLEVLAETRASWVGKDSAEDWESFGTDGLAAAKKMVAELAQREDWKDMNVQSLATAIQKVTTSAAIATDKSRLLRDLPTQITESRDLPALLRSLSKYEQLLPGLKDSPLFQSSIESTAEEIEAPPLPESTPKRPTDHKRADSTKP